MQCPACGSELREVTVGEIRVDLCEGGCGGIWFDWFELSKVDEPDEAPGEILLQAERKANVHVDLERRRHCPRCEGMPMMRHFYSVKRQVAVDECPQCAGFWLDAGELGQIRDLFDSEDEARDAAREMFAELIEEAGEAERAQTESRREKARRVAHILRFICPSYWIPGKQEWGAH